MLHFHHRRSTRLTGYDYTSPGAYFITLVSFHRDEIFGHIMQDEMQLSSLGQIVWEEWTRSVTLRREIRLYDDEFVILPNHLHGIVWIVGADGVRPSDGIRPSDGVRPVDPAIIRGEDRGAKGACHAPLHAPQRKPRSLSSFVAGFKASVTSRAMHELDITGIWQRNYYDHIIRDESDFQKIWNYIDQNPQKWQEDQFNPAL